MLDRRWIQWLPGLLLHTLLTQLILIQVRPAITYRALELGASTLLVGVVTAAFAVPSLLIAVAVGGSIDRRGEHPSLVAGSAVFLVAGVGIWLQGDSLALLALWSMLIGLGHTFCVVAGQALIGRLLGAHERDHAFGHYTVALSLGQVLGPVLFAWLGGAAAVPDTDKIFVGTLVASVFLLGLTGVVRGPRFVHPVVPRERAGALGGVTQVPGLVRIVAISLLVLSTSDVLTMFLPILGTERGIGADFIAMLFTVRAAAALASRLLLGKLLRCLGRQALLRWSLLGSIPGFVIVIYDGSSSVLLAAVTLIGGGFGITMPLLMGWLADVTPASVRGRAFSLRLSGNRLGQILAPIVGGAAASGVGVGALLALSGLALGATAWLVSGADKSAPERG